MKIGDLESALKNAQASMKSEKEKAKDLDARLAEERHQREVVGSKEKQEVQKIINDLNREATAAKDESRGLRKDIESREIELNSWRERLSELEHGLQEILGEEGATKSNLVFVSITKPLPDKKTLPFSRPSPRYNVALRKPLKSSPKPAMFCLKKSAHSRSATLSSNPTASSRASFPSSWKRSDPPGVPTARTKSSGRRPRSIPAAISPKRTNALQNSSPRGKPSDASS